MFSGDWDTKESDTSLLSSYQLEEGIHLLSLKWQPA